MTRDIKPSSIIYCHVSDPKQRINGDGLGSQEAICRFARSPRAHCVLRDAVAKVGGKLESPKSTYGDDPDDDLLEIIEAAFAGEQRRKNAEQTQDRMRGRMMNGFWVFQAPWGYRYDKAPGGGHHLVRDEPFASIIQEALEGYASGRFGSPADVRQFFQSNPLFPRAKHGLVTYERVNKVLTQPLYARHLELPRWDISLRKAQHEGLISLETFSIIQDRLAGKGRAPTRKGLNVDFPMRGFVACADCRRPMTAAWATGTGGRYAYYMCRQPGCVGNGKSIARAKVEEALEVLVRSLTPSDQLVQAASAFFRHLWDRRARQGKRLAHCSSRTRSPWRKRSTSFWSASSMQTPLR